MLLQHDRYGYTYLSANNLSPGRSKAVKVAMRLLTTPQRGAIGRRMRAVGNPPPLVIRQPRNDVLSDEGPSKRKGKRADPRN